MKASSDQHDSEVVRKLQYRHSQVMSQSLHTLLTSWSSVSLCSLILHANECHKFRSEGEWKLWHVWWRVSSHAVTESCNQIFRPSKVNCEFCWTQSLLTIDFFYNSKVQDIHLLNHARSDQSLIRMETYLSVIHLVCKSSLKVETPFCLCCMTILVLSSLQFCQNNFVRWYLSVECLLIFLMT